MGLTSQYQQAEFADPQNGQFPVDADQVTANDNALRVEHNDHDADRTIHIESGTLAARPAASTVGAFYLVNSGASIGKLYYDTGAAWVEIPYTPSAAGTDGSHLIDLDADQLTSGTVPDARFPATLPAISGANLTNLDASDLASGTIPDARFPATLPAVNGSLLTNLENLNADELATGTVPSARVVGDYNGITGLGTLVSGSVPPSLIPAGTFGGAGKYIFPATAAGYASINLPPGTAPSAPADGDLWVTTAALFVRINGATVTLAEIGGGIVGAGTSGKISRFISANELDDSSISDDGTDATTGRDFNVGRYLTADAQPRCMVYASAGSVADEANVEFANEIYDVGSMHDTVTNNSRVTVPVSGLYMLTLVCNGSPAGGTSGVEFWKNGSDMFTALAQPVMTVVNNDFPMVVVVPLAANDYVEVHHSNSGTDAFNITRVILTVAKIA